MQLNMRFRLALILALAIVSSAAAQTVQGPANTPLYVLVGTKKEMHDANRVTWQSVPNCSAKIVEPYDRLGSLITFQVLQLVDIKSYSNEYISAALTYTTTASSGPFPGRAAAEKALEEAGWKKSNGVFHFWNAETGCEKRD